MKQRSVEFWLGVSGGVLVIVLVAVAYAHHRYQQAQSSYRAAAEHLVFRPHYDTLAVSRTAGHESDKWLRLQSAAVTVAAATIIVVLVLVVRRRNARLAAVHSADLA